MKKIILIAMLILISLLIVSCTDNNLVNDNNKNADDSITLKDTKITNLKIETDKELYHSNEVMHITITFEVNLADQKTADINLYGINSNYNRLDNKEQIKLDNGNNIYTYDFTTPKCNTCSGISAGNYDVNFEINVNDKNYNISKTIRIEQ